MKRTDMRVYAVTDRHWLNGETLYSQVEKALEGGATFIQLREKKLDEESFLKEAIEIQKLCKKHHVPFVINDNVDIALKINADGVHVGQSDMEAGDVRAKLGKDKIIGEAQIQKIRTGEIASKETLNTLCNLLHCQPGDILEYIEDAVE